MTEYPPELNELFAQIGMKLMAAREGQNLTLEDISARTRINLSFLKMIEEGNLAGLPGLTFVKGFIRNYMSVLELHDEELEADLQRLTLTQDSPVNQALSSPRVNVLDSETRGLPWFRLGLYGVLAVLLLWMGYLVFSGPEPPETAVQPEIPATPPVASAPADGGDSAAASSTPRAPAQNAAPSGRAAEAPVAQPPATAPEPAPAPTPPVASATPARPAPSAPPRGNVAPAEGRQKLELTIRGLESTWLRLSIDRAPPIEVLMEPAETVSWQANQEIRLTIGKSQGVAVYLNGEEIVLPPEANRLVPEMVLNRLTLLKLEN